MSGCQASTRIIEIGFAQSRSSTHQVVERCGRLAGTARPSSDRCAGELRQSAARGKRAAVCNTPKPCTEPPYSGGQDRANDLNANLKYPTLDARIESTYAARSTAQFKTSLYDSYLRAFRWATDRVGDHGIVAYVSNGGWIDSNTADGIRLTLADEYSRIYVYNMRGNQRTAGDQSRREGGKVFGSGSRSTVAVFIGVRNPEHVGSCEVFYRDIGDYLTRERKLEIVAVGDLESVDWQAITPNADGDWVNQRSDDFSAWPVIGGKNGESSVFAKFSGGLKTNRDAWVDSFSAEAVNANVRRMVNSYNSQADHFDGYCAQRSITDRRQNIDAFIDTDSFNISWSDGLKSRLARGTRLAFNPESHRDAIYRPFHHQTVYFDSSVIERPGGLTSMFPTRHHANIGMYAPNPGSMALPFMCLMTDRIIDLGAGAANFYPRWTYEKAEPDDSTLDLAAGSAEVDEYGYSRVDNITDGILRLYREAVGDQVTKDDIFFYVYGLLHDPAYRSTYAADLKKMLPHIPTPETLERFEQLAIAGRALSGLHVGYEDVEPYPVDVQLKPGADLADRETWRVTKLKWAKKKDPDTSKNVDDHTKLIYNPKVTITGIPEDAERYMLGSRSALAWIIDRYQVKTDKASGIVNDPNDWCDEHDDPRYIVDLIAKVTTVAVETMKIVDGLAEIG
ncbi:helicase [Mycobacterium liflandii]|nr:helicase [Mycobacterium liflandii]